MNDPLAVMLTMTTYGSWLRGDDRGWVEDGVIRTADPVLQSNDRARMKHDHFQFQPSELLNVGQCIGNSLTSRLAQRIFALTVQTWHIHLIVQASETDIAVIAKCTKDAVRWGLRIGRPIWSDKYDKRYCFDDTTLRQRIEYVERHNLLQGWSARPWEFIEIPEMS